MRSVGDQTITDALGIALTQCHLINNRIAPQTPLALRRHPKDRKLVQLITVNDLSTVLRISLASKVQRLRESMHSGIARCVDQHHSLESVAPCRINQVAHEQGCQTATLPLIGNYNRTFTVLITFGGGIAAYPYRLRSIVHKRWPRQPMRYFISWPLCTLKPWKCSG